MPLKLKETNISNEHNRLKNPNWREANQLAVYYCYIYWSCDTAELKITQKLSIQDKAEADYNNKLDELPGHLSVRCQNVIETIDSVKGKGVVFIIFFMSFYSLKT